MPATLTRIDAHLAKVQAELKATREPEARETLQGLIDRLLDERNEAERRTDGRPA